MQEASPEPDRILQLGYAFRASKALLSAVELDVFTALAEGPLELDSLRKKLGIAERGARDFFDVLVALAMLERDQAGRYRNAPETDRYLDARKPTYIGAGLAHLNARMYPSWNLLTLALRTGRPQGGASASDYFPTLYADQSALDTFVRGMTGGSLLAAKAIAASFPWSQHKTIIDVGTAQGCLPVVVAQAHPHLTGGGFDLPQVGPAFQTYVGDHGVADRLRFYPGDFLSDPLPSADVIVMGRVLHNWDLATKKTLLGKAYDALPPDGVLLVYERLIDDDRRMNSAALLASLHMLIVTEGGFDFTGTDCIGWMRESGFRDARTQSLVSGLSMIIAVK